MCYMHYINKTPKRLSNFLGQFPKKRIYRKKVPLPRVFKTSLFEVYQKSNCQRIFVLGTIFLYWHLLHNNVGTQHA